MPADQKTMAKIGALIKTATDKGASEEEQRTAAHTACKMMREAGVHVSSGPATNGKGAFGLNLQDPLTMLIAGAVISKVIGKVID